MQSLWILELDLMLLAVLFLALFVAVPNALAGCALLDGITLLSARRTHLGRGGLIFRGGFGVIILAQIRRATWSRAAEQLPLFRPH